MAKQKLFLADFTFRCGEGEIPFHHTLYAPDLEDAEKQIDAYLRGFAPEANSLGHLSYEYYNGYYAVIYQGLEETEPDRVVTRLMMHDP